MRKRDLLDKAFHPFSIFLVVAVLSIFTEVMVEVSFRYLLHIPLPWGAEVSQTLLVWMTFIGSAVAFLRGEHMSVNLIMNWISSPSLRRFCTQAGRLAILGFLLVGTWGGWQVVIRTWFMRTTALQVPAGILYLAFPLACLFMVPIALRDLVRGWKE
ncbi:MAG: TRAP transporter small permease [Thermovirgaceae bacterium]|nr:TRAP transporter small permease [Thermovirgaceae bacterium]